MSFNLNVASNIALVNCEGSVRNNAPVAGTNVAYKSRSICSSNVSIVNTKALNGNNAVYKRRDKPVSGVTYCIAANRIVKV